MIQMDYSFLGDKNKKFFQIGNQVHQIGNYIEMNLFLEKRQKLGQLKLLIISFVTNLVKVKYTNSQ